MLCSFQKHRQLLPTYIAPPIVKEITAAERDEKVTGFFSGFYSNKANPILLAALVWACFLDWGPSGDWGSCGDMGPCTGAVRCT